MKLSDRNFFLSIAYFVAGLFAFFLILSGAQFGGGGLINVFGDKSPPHGTWYPSIYNGVVLDQDVFYYNIGASIRHAREADILMIGSSRLGMGLDWQKLESFSREKNLKIYNMSFGSAGSMDLSLELIKMHHLTPKILIANIDNSPDAIFFSRGFTDQTKLVMAEGQFRRKKYLFSKNTQLWLWNLNRYIPFSSWLTSQFEPWQLMYRSVETGNWYSAYFRQMNSTNQETPIANSNFGYGDPNCKGPEQVEAARDFLKEMATVGSRLLFTLVPHNSACKASLEKLSKDLNVEFFAPDVPALTLRDGSHLSESSAAKFTEKWLQQLAEARALKEMNLTSTETTAVKSAKK